MTRKANDKQRMTPFSHWIRKWCKDSRLGLSVTNLDFVVAEYKQKKIFLLEEKQHMSDLHYAQKQTFILLDKILKAGAPAVGYEYWGFYLLQLPEKHPVEGMKLNYKLITSEELKCHMDFENKFCDSLF